MSGGRRLAASGLLAMALLLPAAAEPQTDPAISRLLSEAAALERDGDVEGALGKYELLVEQFPEAAAAAEALLRLAVGNLRLERPEAAEEAARTLIRTHPRRRQAAGAYTLLGRMQTASAEDVAGLEAAAETLDNAVLLFPRVSHPDQPWRAEAAVRGARLALRLGRDADAARALAEVVDLEPRSRWSAAARLDLATLLVERGGWREAGELLQEVIVAAGESEKERAQVEIARSGLAMIHRLALRPESGRARWLEGRLVTAAQRPVAVAAHPDGRVAVSDAKGSGDAKGSTVVLDPAGTVVARFSHDEPRRNAWNGDELLVATSEAAATHPRRRGSGLRFSSPPSAKKPTIKPLLAVEPAPYGGWWVLAGKPDRVLLYEPGRRLHETVLEGKGREPVDLASDRRGRLLVLDQRARSVTRFAAGDDDGERLIAANWDRAEALAVDLAGNIYVLDRGERRIDLFDREGSKLGSVGPALPGGLELERPSDLAVDGAGRLWIADSRLGLVVLE